MPKDAGFTDVASAVKERSANTIVWNSGTELDKQADEQIQTFLKRDLTADAAVQVALLNNRDLQAMYSDLGVAQADVIQAGLFKNPFFDGRIKFPVSGGKPDLELGAVLSFLDVFYIPLKKRVAAARFEETKLRIAGVVLEFAAQVRRTFYLHEANEQMLELRQSIVQGLGVSLDIANRLYEVGNITDLNLARQRALAEAAKLQLRSAEVAARQSREQLNALMGVWGTDTGWQSEQRLPEIPQQRIQVSDIERLSLERSLDLSTARQRIVVAGEQLGLSKSTTLLPDAVFGPHAERNDGAWEIGPSLEFAVPLFDQGQPRISAAAAELRRAQQEYYALAVRIRAAARAARDRLQGAQDRALYYRDIALPLSERILNEAQLQYNAMQLGIIDVIRAREQQIETAASYIDSLRDYWLAWTDLQGLMNGHLPSASGFKPNPIPLITGQRSG